MTRTNPLDFYFDFSSPYGYLASEKIDALAARYDRTDNRHPILLGVAFSETGGAPLTTLPMKGDYSAHDFSRSARFMDAPYTHPAHFPVSTKHAARAYFSAGCDISSADQILTLAAEHGCERAELAAALEAQALKDRLQIECTAALQKSVFGSPLIIVDGEPFFGADRRRRSNVGSPQEVSNARHKHPNQPAQRGLQNQRSGHATRRPRPASDDRKNRAWRP